MLMHSPYTQPSSLPGIRQTLVDQLAPIAKSHHVRTSDEARAFLQRQRPAQDALIRALESSDAFREIFASQLHDAMEWISPEQADKAAADIITKRLGEQKAMRAVLENDAGLADALALHMQHYKEAHETLSAEKRTEVMLSLVQPQQGKATAEALVHIHANTNAQMILHEQLAEIFKDGGRMSQVLLNAMLKASPKLDVADATELASRFMQIRRERAELIVEAMRPGSDVIKDAEALSLRLRHTPAPAPALHKPSHASNQLGEDIAFGLQQTLACWATDFIDPYLGKLIQDKFQDHDHHGTLAHTWGGEIVGDSLAFFAFLGTRRYFPQSIAWLKSTAAVVGDKAYDTMGRKSLRVWSAENHIDENSDEYQRKLAEFKDFQADNTAKSSVIAASSVAFNVATQKAMGNTHSLKVITASKIAGAAITWMTMMGLRFILPKSTHELDEELSKRYFTPVIRKTQHLFGAAADEPEPQAESKITSFTDYIRNERSLGLEEAVRVRA